MPAARSKPDPLDQATEVFVKGFGFTRSITHPYVSERVDSMWVLRDAPRKRAEDYRREEYVVRNLDPAKVDRAVRAKTRGRYAVCAMIGIGESDLPLRTAYKALGYRFKVSEPVMMHPLKTISRVKSPAVIQRVLTRELADQMAKAAETRQILPEYLVKDAPTRSYVALIDGEIVGWVTSVVCAAGNWCANLFVLPKFRRMGIASALMSKMLQDDRANGAKRAVLTASHAGAKLYITLGYRQVGSLLLFTPRK